MRQLRLLLLGLLIFPQLASALAVPLLATTTTGTIFAFPTVVNSTNPILMSPSFFGSSTVATTTILNKTNHFGPVDCGPGGLIQGNLSGLEYCNTDNTDAGGVQLIAGNPTRGSNAWVGVTMNNDQADATLTHFAGLYYNSSIYTSTFFGGLFGFPSLTAFQNTDGPLLLLSSTSTKSKAFIEMGTGGLGSTSIGFILDGNQNVGLSTSTPGSRLSVQGNEFIAGNITSTSTAASIFPYASSTVESATTICFTGDVCRTTWPSGGSSFAYPFTIFALNTWSTTTAATNTSMWTQGVFFSSSTVAASQLPYASTTAESGTNLLYTNATTTSFFSSTASTTSFYANGLGCAAGFYLTWSAGTFGCAQDQSGSGSVYPFTPTTYGTQQVSATSTAIQDFAGLISATTTFGTITASSSITNQGVKSALVLNSIAGLEGAYGGAAACTNQVVTAISAIGATTCTTVANAMLTNSSLTIGTGGILTGAATVSLGNTITLNASSSPTVGFIIATSTTQTSILPYASSTAISVSNLTSGNCVQASTGGFLTTTGSACGSGGGGTYPFTPTTYNGNQVSATTTGIFANVTLPAYGFVASSTFFTYASTTALSVSGNSFLGTVLSGTWNGSVIGTAYGGTGLSNPGSGAAEALVEFAGATGADAISPGAQYTVLQSTSGGGGWTPGALHLDQSAAVTGILPVLNGGSGAAGFNKYPVVGGGGTTALAASSTLWLVGVNATGTTASTFIYSTTTYGSFTSASSTQYFGAGLDAGCNGTSFLQTTSGRFGCAVPAGGTGAAYPFTSNSLNTFATNTISTTTSIWDIGVFFSSSTAASSQFPYASSTMHSMTTASTTNLIVSSAGTGSTKCAQLAADGTLSATAAACAGSFAFPFTVNALNTWSTTTLSTSTSLWTQGVFFASSTVAASQFPLASTTYLTASTEIFVGGSGATDQLALTPGNIDDSNISAGITLGNISTINAVNAAGGSVSQTGNTRSGLNSNGNMWHFTTRDSGGGTNNPRLTINNSYVSSNADSSGIGIGTSTPWWPLQIANTQANFVPQLTLTDNVATDNHWSFWNKAGTLFIATSSPGTVPAAGAAGTSTATALMIGTNGVTNLQALALPNIQTCNTTSALTTTNGVVGCGAITGSGSSFAWPFTFNALTASTFGTTTISTSSSLWTYGVFFSSSTAQASQFPYASSTMHSMTTGSTTNLYVSSAPNALALMGVDGLLGKFAGSSGVCTNQFPTSISTVGALGGCTSVADAFFTGQLGIAHGGTNASLSGANQVVFMNSANTALATNASSLFSWFDSAARHTVGTSTATLGTVTIGSSTVPQLVLVDNNTSDNGFALRTAGGNFYLATTSPATFATSTSSWFSLLTSGAFSTSTFSFVDTVLKNTSANVLSILDGFGTQDVVVNTASTTGSIFTVAATTSPNLQSGAIKLLDVDQYGHLMASSTGATPTVSACGTSPTVTANSTDSVGSVTTGTASPTSCTITFAHAFVNSPVVMIDDASTAVTADISAISTTAFTVTLSAALNSTKIYWIVVQGPGNL